MSEAAAKVYFCCSFISKKVRTHKKRILPMGCVFVQVISKHVGQTAGKST